MADMTTCAVEDCGRPVYVRGWCTRHYQRWRANGDPTMIRNGRGMTLAEKLAARLDTSGDCWLWTGGTNGGGYGRMAVSHSRNRPAHLVAYELAYGPVPAGRQIHHRCEVKLCCRPGHLEAVTPRENLMASDTPARRNAVKTHCPAGHEYTPENTKTQRRGNSVMRSCRRCAAERAAASRRSR